ERRIQRQAIAEIVALDRLEAGLEAAPGDLADTGDPVHPQPLYVDLFLLYQGLGLFHQCIPGTAEILTGLMDDRGPLLCAAQRQKQRVAWPWTGQAYAMILYQRQDSAQQNRETKQI